MQQIGSELTSGPLSFSSTAAARFKPANSVCDIFFDFRFERYVTPHIIRLTWVVALILGIICAGIYSYSALSVWLPESGRHPEAKQRMRVQVEIIDDILPSPRNSQKIWTSFASLLSVMFVAIGLLWIRVWLEMMIVIFNIALSIASIDKKTKG